MIATNPHRWTSSIVLWWRDLSMIQIVRTAAWVAVGVALLDWWANAGAVLASRLLEAALRTPQTREQLLAGLGAFVIARRLIGRPVGRLRRTKMVLAPTLASGAATAARDIGADPRWSLHRRARHEAAHAVACAWAGERVELVDIVSAPGRGGRTVFSNDARPLADQAWGCLVSLVAGQLVDLDAGIHDYGASRDMSHALEAVAAIVSTGQRPAGYVGDLTSDALLVGARREAATALSTHADVVDAVVEALLSDPTRPVVGAALDRLLEPIYRPATKAGKP